MLIRNRTIAGVLVIGIWLITSSTQDKPASAPYYLTAFGTKEKALFELQVVGLENSYPLCTEDNCLVKIYASKEDYLRNINAIDSGLTNYNGDVFFKLEPAIYWYRCEKDGMTNELDLFETFALKRYSPNRMAVPIEKIAEIELENKTPVDYDIDSKLKRPFDKWRLRAYSKQAFKVGIWPNSDMDDTLRLVSKEGEKRCYHVDLNSQRKVSITVAALKHTKKMSGRKENFIRQSGKRFRINRYRRKYIQKVMKFEAPIVQGTNCILNSNRQILNGLSFGKRQSIGITKEALERIGFSFEYCTAVKTNEKILIYSCYDFYYFSEDGILYTVGRKNKPIQ